MIEDSELSNLILFYSKSNIKRINVEIIILDYNYVHKCNDTLTLKSITNQHKDYS